MPIERFYELMRHLSELQGQGGQLSEYTGRLSWPQRGVYFFQEPGELRSNADSVQRIVRVGTHAISANSKSRLWGRLRAHRGGRDRSGNHRGSIFRLHAGVALLQRDRAVIGEFPTWSIGQSAPPEVRKAEVEHERRVSDHLGQMSVLWVEVPDDPGPMSQRAFIERNAIALLSNHRSPFDPPSPKWLGIHSVRSEIRESGLWNLNHVNDPCDLRFMEVLAGLIDEMRSRHA